MRKALRVTIFAAGCAAFTAIPVTSGAHETGAVHSHDNLAIQIGYSSHGSHGSHGRHKYYGSKHHRGHGYGYKHGYGGHHSSHRGYGHYRHHYPSYPKYYGHHGYGHHEKAPGYYCKHCHYRTHVRDDFYSHMYHRHHIAWSRVAALLVWHPLSFAFVYGH